MADPAGMTARPDARTVFVSYASQDAAAAHAVVSAIERTGLTCWIAPRDVVPGALYASEIVRAINECQIVALVLSAHSAASAHVGKELERASSKNRRILTLRTDATPLPSALEYFLSESQWIEVGSDGIESAAAKLADAIRRHLGSSQAILPDVTRPAHGTPGPPRPQWRRAVMLGSAAVLTLAMAAAATWNLWPGNAASPTLTAATSTSERTSVAVMPFANLTGDASKDYLGDGMAEELINVLAKVPGLTIPSRTSSFAYKGRNTDLKQIAKDLNVSTILEGSVRSAGETIRVTAQLIDAQTDRHLWSQTYDRQYADLFKLQDDLAHEIVTAFKTTMNANLPEFQSQVQPTKDAQAYALYLQGQAHITRNSDESLSNAIAVLEKAIGRDPGFARAYLALASARGLHGEPLVDIERDARKAIELDPGLTNLAKGSVFANVEAKRRNWGASEEIFRTLIPNTRDPSILNFYVLSVLWPTGQLQKSFQVDKQALDLAPASGSLTLQMGMISATLGLDADAVGYVDAAAVLGVDPSARRSRQVYADTAARAGRLSEAADLMASVLPDTVRALGGEETVRLIYTAMGNPERKAAAIVALRRLNDRLKPQDWVLKVWGMNWASQLGALDLAYELADQLRVRFADNSPTNAWAWLWTPEIRAFRQDARFQAFTTRLGLMDFWRKYGPPDACELQGGKLTCH
jgi:TolB-like protein